LLRKYVVLHALLSNEHAAEEEDRVATKLAIFQIEV
jgi:hypothetical protein